MFIRIKHNAAGTNGSEWSPGYTGIPAATSLSRSNTAQTENDYEFDTSIIAEGSTVNTEETAHVVTPISSGQLAEENLHHTAGADDYDNVRDSGVDVRDSGVDASNQVTSNQQPQDLPVYAKMNKFSSVRESDPSSDNLSVGGGNTLIENEFYAARPTVDNTLIENELYTAM